MVAMISFDLGNLVGAVVFEGQFSSGLVLRRSVSRQVLLLVHVRLLSLLIEPTSILLLDFANLLGGLFSEFVSFVLVFCHQLPFQHVGNPFQPLNFRDVSNMTWNGDACSDRNVLLCVVTFRQCWEYSTNWAFSPKRVAWFGRGQLWEQRDDHAFDPRDLASWCSMPWSLQYASFTSRLHRPMCLQPQLSLHLWCARGFSGIEPRKLREGVDHNKQVFLARCG